MFYPNFDAVKALAKTYTVIPVCAEYNADLETPVSVFKKLRKKSHCFLLESVEGEDSTTRYSIIGRNPFLTFTNLNHKTTIETREGKVDVLPGNPYTQLERLFKQYKAPSLKNLPAFCGGAVGYFSYDTARLFEKLPNTPEDDTNIPDLKFLFADEIAVFDHRRQKLILVVNVFTGGNLKSSYEDAVIRIERIRKEIDSPLPPEAKSKQKKPDLTPVSSMSKETFIKKVERTKEYIKKGDIFQAVISQRFCIRTGIDPFEVYRAVRTLNPSPYMFFLDFGDFQLAGASPEMLVRVEDSKIETRPIAGTRPRGKNKEEDLALAQDLLEDPKENAEHVMLVDLGRNDIGRLCEFGTVQVDRFRYIQNFSHVMHMTSNVSGKMKKEHSIFDAISAVLPAGTLSGAPKIRAMEIIDELEPVKRGFYGGAVGYLSFNGNLDSCITIRTALFQDKKAYIQSGGGIVHDSVPENEYQESVNKAASMMKAIALAYEL